MRTKKVLIQTDQTKYLKKKTKFGTVSFQFQIQNYHLIIIDRL